MTRREQEITEKKAALDDMKRKNQMIQDKVASWVLYKHYLIVGVVVAGPRTNQNSEHEAGRAAGGAPDQRGHGGERHLLPQRQAVRGEMSGIS